MSCKLLFKLHLFTVKYVHTITINNKYPTPTPNCTDHPAAEDISVTFLQSALTPSYGVFYIWEARHREGKIVLGCACSPEKVLDVV